MTILGTKGRDTVDIVFVLFDIGLKLENSVVFQSQVGDQVIALQSMGLRVGIIALYNDREKFNAVIGNKLQKSGIFLNMIKEKGFGSDIISMTNALRKWKKRTEIRFCYVRGLWGPLLIKLAAPFSGIPYVYDVRGDLEDELSSVNSKPLRKKIYLVLERWGIRNANKVTAVTSILAGIVTKKFSLTNVYVIPCCINTADFDVSEELRIEKRKQLGFAPSDIVMVYSGGLSHYQQVPKMLELWKEFINYPNIKFLLLTNQDPHSHPVILNDLNQFGEKLTHLSVPKSDIAQILSLANIGFMLRDSRSLNNAASPVKFPEYLASGLAVAASPGIGDASDLIITHQLGVLIDPLDLETGANQLNDFLINLVPNYKEVVANKSRMIAKEYYDWSSFKELMLKLYSVNHVES